MLFLFRLKTARWIQSGIFQIVWFERGLFCARLFFPDTFEVHTPQSILDIISEMPIYFDDC